MYKENSNISVLGFLGTGALTSMLVERLTENASEKYEIVISGRNREISEQLESRYGVKRISCNQELVDQSDIVIVCLPILKTLGELSRLSFSNDTVVVSLVGGLKLSDLKQVIHPSKATVGMLPGLPSACGSGLTVLFPHHRQAVVLFNNFGDVIVTQSNEEYESVSVFGGVSGCLFYQARCLVEQFQATGLSEDISREIIARCYLGIGASLIAKRKMSLNEVVSSVVTPGGVTEKGIQKLNCFFMKDAWRAAIANMRQKDEMRNS